MAKRHGRFVREYFDALNISGFARAGSLKAKVDTAEVTNFLSAGNKEYLEGNYDATSSFAAFFDDADDGFDESMFSKLTTQDDDHYHGTVIGLTATVPAIGDVVYERLFRWTGQPRDYDVGGAIMLAGDGQVSGGVGRGAVVRAASVTATGATAGVNIGATTGKLVVATYRILSVVGSGSLTLGIDESQNDGGGDPYAAIAALSSGALTAVGVTRKTTSGNTEAWKRLNVTAYSGFTSALVLATLTVVQ